MKPLHIFLGVLIAALWGANFVAAKHGLAYFPPCFLSALRFVIASLLLLPFVPRPSRQQMLCILPVSAMSTLHFALGFTGLYLGLDISSSALIGQLGVPFSCILGAIFLSDRIGIWRSSGIVIAFIGTAIVAGAPNILAHMPAFYAAVASTFTWGVANVLIKRVKDLGSMAFLAWMLLFATPMMFALSYFVEPVWPSLATVPLDAALSLFYTAIGSTIFAFGLWYFLLARYSVSQVTPYSLLTPVFGIAFGQLFFTEELTMPVIAGGIITIIGVAIIVFRRPKTIMLGEAT